MRNNPGWDVASGDQSGEAFTPSISAAPSQRPESVTISVEPPPGVMFSQWNEGWTIEASIRHELYVSSGLMALICYVLGAGCAYLAIVGSIPGVAVALMMLFVTSFGGMWLWFALVSAFGCFKISNYAGQVTVFVGIGSVGYSRHFSWSSVTGVQLQPARQPSGAIHYVITLLGPNVWISAWLEPYRSMWIAGTLQRMLAWGTTKEGKERVVAPMF